MNITSGLSAASPIWTQLKSAQRTLAALEAAQTEMSSGRVADEALQLGANKSEAIGWRIDKGRLTGMVTANGRVATQISGAQTALDSVRQNAENFLADAVNLKDGNGSTGLISSEGASAFASLAGLLNTTVDGVHLFSGSRSDTAPMDASAVETSGAGTSAIKTAFVNFFGFAPDDPAAGSITADSMKSFLEGSYSALFSDGNWQQDWSAAADRPVTSTISLTDTAQTSVSANDPALRKIASAFALAAVVDPSKLGAGASQEMGAWIADQLGSGIDGVTQAQSKLGIAQQQITDASDRMTAQSSQIEAQIGKLEGVDEADAATRVNALVQQLQTSYSMIAQLQKLSLLDAL